MALNATVQKKVLNFTEEKKQIYVATAQRGDVIDTDKISKFVAQDTGARPAQVKMILNSLINSMMAWLEEGHGVRLGNFGSFLPSVRSQSSEDPNEVGIKRVRLTFYPSKKLSEMLGDVSYTTINPYKETVPSEEEPGGSTGGDGTEME